MAAFGDGTPGGVQDDIRLRPLEPGDRPEVLALLARSMRQANDRRAEQLFAWKHEDNVFGRSLMLVATAGEAIVGLRALMRWQFEHDRGCVPAVRAVDTAADPDYQGRRVFTRLTFHAIDVLHDEGVAFVFNEPNAQSLPGYLKMGWQTVGRVPIMMRPHSLGRLVRLRHARTAAALWSEQCGAGEDAAACVKASRDVISGLLASQPRRGSLRTVRSPEYFAWRYGLEPLCYRALPADTGVQDGLAIFRVRPRGGARELVLDELLVPEGDHGLAQGLVRTLAASVEADYILRVGRRPVSNDGFVRLPRQGPLLTWRSVCASRKPALPEWDLTMGDVELF